MHRKGYWYFTFLLGLVTLASCGDTEYTLTLEQPNVVSYAATSQPIPRIYEVSLTKTAEGNTSTVSESRENGSIVILVEPNNGGKVSELIDDPTYDPNFNPEFKTSVALSTDANGKARFLWQAGSGMGNQTVSLSVASEVTPRGEESSYLSLPLSHATPPTFTCNVVVDGIVYSDGDEVPVAIFGDEQSGFKQIWTGKNLSAGNIDAWPNGDSQNEAQYGALYKYENAASACPQNYRLATYDEMMCMADYLEGFMGCEWSLPPFSIYESRAGKAVYTVDDSEVYFQTFRQQASFWLQDQGLYINHPANHPCGRISSPGREITQIEAHCVRCVKVDEVECHF